MKTITVEVPEESLRILGDDPRRLGRDMLIAAVLHGFKKGGFHKAKPQKCLE